MAKYGFTLSNGQKAVVNADSEEEARQKKDAYEQKNIPAETVEKPSAFETARAGLSKTGLSIASSLPESLGINQSVLKKSIAKNKETLEAAGNWGTAADIGAQTAAAIPAAMVVSRVAPILGAGATGLKVLQQSPRLAKALGALTTSGATVAGTAGESALISEPGEKEDAAGFGALIQTGIESIPIVGRVLGKAGATTIGQMAGVTDYIRKQAVKVFEANPGISKTEMAKRLEEMVTGLDLPLANSAKSEIMRRLSQIAEYIPLTGAREAYTEAEKRLRNELMDIAEGPFGVDKINPPPPGPTTLLGKAKEFFTGKDKGSYGRYTQDRIKDIQDKSSKAYDKVINTRNFDPQKTYQNIIIGIKENSDPFVRDLLNPIVDKLKKSINPDTGVVSGKTIGTLKAELRALIPEDAPPYRRQIMRDVIKQLDDDLAKQMPVDDAKLFKELNATYPDRKMVEGTVAKVPLGEFNPKDARAILQKESSTRQLARGEGRSQELIDLSAEIMKRKPPESSSPWAFAAIIGTVAAEMGMMSAGAIALGRTKIVDALRHGRVPEGMENKVEFKQLQEWFNTLSDKDAFAIIDKVRPLTTTVSGVAGAQAANED